MSNRREFLTNGFILAAGIVLNACSPKRDTDKPSEIKPSEKKIVPQSFESHTYLLGRNSELYIPQDNKYIQIGVNIPFRGLSGLTEINIQLPHNPRNEMVNTYVNVEPDSYKRTEALDTDNNVVFEFLPYFVGKDIGQGIYSAQERSYKGVKLGIPPSENAEGLLFIPVSDPKTNNQLDIPIPLGLITKDTRSVTLHIDPKQESIDTFLQFLTSAQQSYSGVRIEINSESGNEKLLAKIIIQKKDVNEHEVYYITYSKGSKESWQ